jgi:HlyD family secretion protein
MTDISPLSRLEPPEQTRKVASFVVEGSVQPRNPSERTAIAARKRPKGRRWGRWIGLAVLLTLGGGSFFFFRSGVIQKKPTLIGKTEAVTTQSLTVRVEASGSLEPMSTVNVSPKTAGRLAELYVKQGDRVRKNQIVARMDWGTLKAELAQSQAQLAQIQAQYAQTKNGTRREEVSQAKAQVAAAKAKAEFSGKKLARYQVLANEGAISRNDLDQYLSEHQSNQASVKELQDKLQQLSSGSRPEEIDQRVAQVAESRAKIDQIKTQLEDAIIRAPFDGVVTQTYAIAGAIVTPTTSASSTASATSTSILAIASGIQAKIKVPEISISQIQVGQKVEIESDAYPNRSFPGRVTRISPEAVVENNVTSFQVLVEFLNRQGELRAGMNVDATFLSKTITRAMTVPTVAIATQAGKMGIMVADAQGQPKFQPVTVGLTQNGQTQILKGIKLGDRIFLDIPQVRKNPLAP